MRVKYHQIYELYWFFRNDLERTAQKLLKDMDFRFQYLGDLLWDSDLHKMASNARDQNTFSEWPLMMDDLEDTDPKISQLIELKSYQDYESFEEKAFKIIKKATKPIIKQANEMSSEEGLDWFYIVADREKRNNILKSTLDEATARNFLYKCVDISIDFYNAIYAADKGKRYELVKKGYSLVDGQTPNVRAEMDQDDFEILGIQMKAKVDEMLQELYSEA